MSRTDNAEGGCPVTIWEQRVKELERKRDELLAYARRLIQAKVYWESGNIDGDHDCAEFTAPARDTCDFCAQIAEAERILGPDWWKPSGSATEPKP